MDDFNDTLRDWTAADEPDPRASLEAYCRAVTGTGWERLPSRVELDELFASHGKPDPFTG